jgi:acetylornithine deacetylase
MTLEASYAGEGGHSSRADEMPAPLVEMARLAVAWRGWGHQKRGEGPEGFKGMCANVARIDGGIAFNVVPKDARLTFSVRPPPGANNAAIVKELTAVAQAGVEVKSTLDNPAFATRDVEAFRQFFGDSVEEPVDLAFWTEAALLAEAGIDSVVFGPGDIAQAHAADEWVDAVDLLRAKETFAAVFRSTRG